MDTTSSNLSNSASFILEVNGKKHRETDPNKIRISRLTVICCEHFLLDFSPHNKLIPILESSHPKVWAQIWSVLSCIETESYFKREAISCLYRSATTSRRTFIVGVNIPFSICVNRKSELHACQRLKRIPSIWANKLAGGWRIWQI